MEMEIVLVFIAPFAIYFGWYLGNKLGDFLEKKILEKWKQ